MMQLAKNQPIRRILGKVEIETILKRLKGEKLKQTERNYLSRSIKPKLIAARILAEQKLLEKINSSKKNTDKIITYNLSRYGYDLILDKKINREKTLPIEELICFILTRKPSSRYIEAIPILLIKNTIDKFKIAELASRYNIRNKIGYLLETANLIAKKMEVKIDFTELIKHLRSTKEKEIAFLGEEKDKEYTKFLLKSSPKRIMDWNLLGRFFDSDFIKNARAYL